MKKTKGALAIAFAAALAFGCNRNQDERLDTTDGYNNRIEGTTTNDMYGRDTLNMNQQNMEQRTGQDVDVRTNDGNMRRDDTGDAREMNDARTTQQGTVTPAPGTTGTTVTPRTTPPAGTTTTPPAGTTTTPNQTGQTGTADDDRINNNPSLQNPVGTDRYQNPMPGNPADTSGNVRP